MELTSLSLRDAKGEGACALVTPFRWPSIEGRPFGLWIEDLGEESDMMGGLVVLCLGVEVYLQRTDKDTVSARKEKCAARKFLSLALQDGVHTLLCSFS